MENGTTTSGSITAVWKVGDDGLFASIEVNGIRLTSLNRDEALALHYALNAALPNMAVKFP